MPDQKSRTIKKNLSLLQERHCFLYRIEFRPKSENEKLNDEPLCKTVSTI